MASTPAADFILDEALVRSLLRAQAPELADRPLERTASGWDNEMWRLGDDLVIRLPRRVVSEPLIEHEQRWLPDLAARLPVPIPAPLVAGTPTADYPCRWTVARWLPGAPLGPNGGSAAMAVALAEFLRALHRPAPADAPKNEWRGVPLATRAERTEAALSELGPLVGDQMAEQLFDRWRSLSQAPVHAGPPLWLHGDLHPLNIVVDEHGRLSAIIDFGDLTSGDPASDLAVAWLAFEPVERAIFQAGLPDVDAAMWTRAHAWAIALGSVVLANTDDAPLLEAAVRAALRRALDDQNSFGGRDS